MTLIPILILILALPYALQGTDMERVEFLMEDHGLGPMPPTVPSVGSMLLFNTNVNPYEEYRALDNLVFTGR